MTDLATAGPGRGRARARDADRDPSPSGARTLPQGGVSLDGRRLGDATLAAYLAELHDQGRGRRTWLPSPRHPATDRVGPMLLNPYR